MVSIMKRFDIARAVISSFVRDEVTKKIYLNTTVIAITKNGERIRKVA